jgi:hypothetical protein
VISDEDQVRRHHAPRRVRPAIDPDIWDVKSPGGEVIGICDTRAKALELARHLSEQITYDVVYYRIVQAEKQAAHDRMVGDE